MDSLKKARDRIDQIDEKIVKLFEERMDIAADVARYKQANQLQIFQSSREQEVLQRVVNLLNDHQYDEDLRYLFKTIMQLSKKKQQKIITHPVLCSKDIAGYYGELHSYCHQAYLHYFEGEGKHYLTFRSGFDALKEGQINALVVPLENSITGLVIEVIDLMKEYDFFINNEYYLDVNHLLLAKEGSTLNNLKKVYSHPQAISQCSEYLAEKRWMIHREYSTSESAKFVRDTVDEDVAAIASEKAKEAYGLIELESNIQNDSNNQTRFVVLKRLNENTVSSKISIMFSLDNHPGTLASILTEFARLNLNLIKIESRPSHNTNWEYLSIIDFEGDISEPHVSALLEMIRSKCLFFKFLGSF